MRSNASQIFSVAVSILASLDVYKRQDEVLLFQILPVTVLRFFLQFQPVPLCNLEQHLPAGGIKMCIRDRLALDHTGLDDAGLLQAASILKLSHIWIDHTAVTYDGLLARCV